MEDQNRISHYS